jgi:dissimilatory sulfite reductase (desulfoviridin) alpha/beta subunit
MVKFRFWDTVRNKMYYDGDYWLPDRYIDPCANNCYPIKVTNHGIIYCKKLVENQNYVEVCEDGKKECYYGNWEHDELSSDRVVFGMGVKIDGKWYFEGDICKDDLGSIFEIVLSDYHQFGCKILNGGVLALTNGLIFPLWQWTKTERIFKIIGNIWDNPELLGGQNEQGN